MRRFDGIVAGVLLVVAIALAGCGGAATPTQSALGATPAAFGENAPPPAAFEDYTSTLLPTSYENALSSGTQLALGILRLESTPQAVNHAQAKTLLPLWQAFQGNALKDEAERNAVLKQIEGALTPDQVKAIAAMHLTNDDMRKYMDEHGMEVRPPGNGTPGAGGGNFGNMSDSQRQVFRATVEAGGGQLPQGGQGGQGRFGNMTDEQRQAFRATVEAGGGEFPQGGQAQRIPLNGTPGPGGRGIQSRLFGTYRIFVAPLVELLTAKASG